MFRKLSLALIVIFTFPFCGPVNADFSVIFYGAGNYDDQKGSPDSPIFHNSSRFAQPGPGQHPRKREILKNSVRDLLKQVGNSPLTIIINDISPAAAKTAKLELADLQKSAPNLILEVAVGDLRDSQRHTDLAYLDNPIEDWFYDLDTGKPFASIETATPNAGLLQKLADLSSAGLLITSYYHDAMVALEQFSSLRFVNLGAGYPYIWPSGKVDDKETTRYLIRPSKGTANGGSRVEFPPISKGSDSCPCKINGGC